MIEKALTTLGIAAAIVVVGNLAGWQPWRRSDGPDHGDWGAILGIAGAAAFTHAFLKEGLPQLPPIDATSWLFWLAIAAGALALVRNPQVKWPSRLTLVAGGGYLLVQPLLEHSWADGGSLRLAVFTALTLVVWAAVEEQTDRAPHDSTVPLGLAFTAAATAGLIAYVSSLTIGLVAAALALGLGGTVVTMWLRSGVTAGGVTATFVPMLAFVLLAAYGYAEIALLPISLVVLALLLVWTGQLLATRSGWLRGPLRVLVAVAPVVIAVPLADDALTPTAVSDESADSGQGESGTDAVAEPEADDDGTYVPY